MQIAGHDIGVVSWCLKAADLGDLAQQVRALGLDQVQLALGPLIFLDDKRKHQQLGQLRASGLVVASGMISFPGEDYSTLQTIRHTGGFVPDAAWAVRRKITEQAAKLAAELGVKQVSTHVGFVPPPTDARYSTMVDRVTEAAGLMADSGRDLLMETGQEPARELLQFIVDVGAPNVGVNFDPGNLILYGAGDPLTALRALGPHIRQVHLKDAVASGEPGQAWGREVVFGTGEVDVIAFLKGLRDIGYTGPLIFEREAGENIAADVIAGIEALRRHALAAV